MRVESSAWMGVTNPRQRRTSVASNANWYNTLTRRPGSWGRAAIISLRRLAVPEANILNHLGPFALSQPLAAIFELNKQVWSQYLTMFPKQEEEDPPAHFMSRRMMHISEITSLALRSNASC